MALMSEVNERNPSHAAIVEVIRAEVGSINRRLERGEARFDRLEEKIESGNQARNDLRVEVEAIRSTVNQNKVGFESYVQSQKTPPWFMGWQPVAIGLGLSLLAGAGLAITLIAGLDILPKLVAIKAAVTP